MKVLHATIADNFLYYSIPDERGNKLHRVKHTAVNAEQLLDVCVTNKIHTAWITPGSKEDKWTAEQAPSAVRYNVNISARKTGNRQLKHITAYRHAGTFEEKSMVTLTWPHYTPWEWLPEHIQCTDPVNALGCIHYLSKGLGEDIDANPGVTGRNLLIYTLNTPAKKAYLARSSVDLTTLPSRMGYDLDYFTPIPEIIDMSDVMHIMAIDKNSMYIAAATSTWLGIGTPRYTNQINEHDLELPLMPGLWHITYRPEDLPDLHPLYERQEWVTTPTLALLMNKLRVPLEITEAYIWEKKARVFEKYAELIWGIRANFALAAAGKHEDYKNLEASRLAYYSMKRVATAGLGILANRKTATFPKLASWYRPDWYYTIVEEAKARLILQVLACNESHGAMPLAISTDCLYYLTTSAEAKNAFPGHFEKQGLGGWKCTAWLPATVDNLQAFRATDTDGKARTAGLAAAHIRIAAKTAREE